jgi:hypothetical protein
MVDDVESPWLHPENMFDLIHSRHLVMAVKNWPKLMKEAYEYITHFSSSNHPVDIFKKRKASC